MSAPYTIWKHSALSLAAAISLGMTLQSCTNMEGTYSDPDKVEIVDDKWNETDANKTAEILIRSMLKNDWVEEHKTTGKGKPYVLIDELRNDTEEHIDTNSLVKAVQTELVKSGKIRFVDGERRDQILKEIKYQQSGEVNAKSAKRRGRQVGADYLLGGSISSQVHKNDSGKKTVSYKTTLTLTDLETAVVVWMEDYQLKKEFKRSRLGL